MTTISPDTAVAGACTAHENSAPVDADSAPPADAGPVNERTSISAGGTALSILATIAFVFALQWAKEFFIPLLFGIFIAYTLNPLVAWLERIKVPRVIGASLIMLGLLGSTAVVATSVYYEAQAIMDEVPMVAYKLGSALKRSDNGEVGLLQKFRNTAAALKKAAGATADADEKPSTPSTATSKPPAPAAAATPSGFDLNDWLWAGSLSAAGFLGQLTMVLFLAFFALLSGDTFKRKLVKLTGPSLSNKKITVHILDDINISIQRYMFMLLVTNGLLALLIWITLHWIGLDNAGAWAVAAGLLHIVPYFGSLIAALTMGFAAFLQFESFSMMFLVAGITLGISSLVGTLVTTWMTGRIAKMNPTAVFVALLFGGWLWGVWGMLLCVPLIVVIKVISEHIDGMQPIAELLGE